MTQTAPSLEEIKHAIGTEFDYGANRRKKKAMSALRISAATMAARPVYQSIDNSGMAWTSDEDKKSIQNLINEDNSAAAAKYEDTIQSAFGVIDPKVEGTLFNPSGQLLSEQIEVSRDLESMDRKSIMDKIIDKILSVTTLVNFNSTLLYIIIALCLLIFVCTCVYKNKSSNFGTTMFGSTNNFGNAIHSFAK